MMEASHIFTHAYTYIQQQLGPKAEALMNDAQASLELVFRCTTAKANKNAAAAAAAAEEEEKGTYVHDHAHSGPQPDNT